MADSLFRCVAPMRAACRRSMLAATGGVRGVAGPGAVANAVCLPAPAATIPSPPPPCGRLTPRAPFSTAARAIVAGEDEIREQKAVVRSAVRARKLDTAFQAATEVVRLAEAHFGLRHPAVASAVNDLGLVCKLRGEEEAAVGHYERSVRLYEELLGKEHVNTATATANLGVLHLAIAGKLSGMDKLGHVDAAQSYLEAALAVRRKLLPPTDPALATTMYYLASALRMQRRYADAERLFLDTIDLLRRGGSERHEAMATALNNYGFLLKEMGETGKAKAIYQQSLRLHEQVFGHDHPDTLTVMYNLARAHAASGEEDIANELQAGVWARYDGAKRKAAGAGEATPPPPVNEG